MRLSPRRLLNAMYRHWVEHLTAESREVVDDALSDNPSGIAMAGNTPVVRTAARSDGKHVPGLAPANIPAPSWWRGDKAAFSSSVAAGQQLGEPAAVRERPRQGLPAIGTAGRMARGVT
jgi:hypothetical protein